MITIEKRTIVLNIEEFRTELINVCKLLKKHDPSTIGITRKGINDHFKIKLTLTDFYTLCDKLGYSTTIGRKTRYLSFKTLEIK